MNAQTTITAAQVPAAPFPPSVRKVPLDLINAVELNGDLLIDAYAFAQGPIENRRASLEQFARRHGLKPPSVAAEALSIRMALLGALMDSLGIVEGEWLATCEAVAKIKLEDGRNHAMPWGDGGGFSYDEAMLQEMIWAYGEQR